MSLREAAQQALEALEYSAECGWESHAITDLRAALAEDAMQRLADEQQEIEVALAEDRPADTGEPSDHLRDATKMVATSQESRQVEPVAWRYIPSERLRDVVLTSDPSQARLAADYGCEVQPLYPAPPKRQPLTEQELEPIRRRMMMEAYNAADDGDSERYNALKVMANDVLDMLLGGEE